VDVFSAVFASYLDAVSNSVQLHMTDAMGTEVQAVIVEHHGIKVPYTYQLWRIKDASVCATFRNDIGAFSRCTLAAQSLFSDACVHLQNNPKTHWRYRKLKNMYCGAAATYKPAIASVSWGEEVKDKLSQARQECSLATAEVLGNNDPAARKQRDAACKRYNDQKSKQGNNRVSDGASQ
jgi:hypothetical protein